MEGLLTALSLYDELKVFWQRASLHRRGVRGGLARAPHLAGGQGRGGGGGGLCGGGGDGTGACGGRAPPLGVGTPLRARAHPLPATGRASSRAQVVEETHVFYNKLRSGARANSEELSLV